MSSSFSGTVGASGSTIVGDIGRGTVILASFTIDERMSPPCLNLDPMYSEIHLTVD